MQHREPSLVLSEDLEGGVGERVGAEGGLEEEVTVALMLTFQFAVPTQSSPPLSSTTSFPF